MPAHHVPEIVSPAVLPTTREHIYGSVPRPPGSTVASALHSAYNILTPIIQLLLSGYGAIRIAPGMPVGEQAVAYSRIQRTFAAMTKAQRQEIEDIKGIIKGLYISQGISSEDVEPGTAIDRHISNLASWIVNLYPVLYYFDPSLVSRINPRSSLMLAARLADLYSRNTGIVNLDVIANFAQAAASKILRNPQLHQGFTADEIDDIAKEGVKNGLVSMRDVSSFVKSLEGAIKLVAPIRDQAVQNGEEFNAAAAMQLANKFAQKYPTLTLDQLALQMRFELEQEARGGEYGELALHPEAQEYIRRAGVPLEELKEQHKKLKEQAANSVFGAGLGAIAKAVHEGAVSLNSPAGNIYLLAMRGEPLPFVHPYQFYDVLVRSGVHPQTASMMLLSPEESKYWLTEPLLNSLRLTQFAVDWGPRFAYIYRSIPGDDLNSKMLRDQLLSRFVSQAGYKNIHHFLALHGPVLDRVSDFRRSALRHAIMQQELAGHANSQWGIIEKITATLQDIGEGRKRTPYSIGDIASDVFGVYRRPDVLNMLGGLQEPPETLKGMEEYSDIMNRGTQQYFDIQKREIPSLDDFYDPSKYVGIKMLL